MRIGSLFSGYGGLDIAVQSVLGGELAWYSEIEPAACQVLAAHHPGVPNLGDITTVDWADVEPVDVLTGGYPCQPFSHAGKRQGKNDERHLWPFIADALRSGVLRPGGVAVFENVDGHRSLGLADVMHDLAALGMSARWGVVRAADAGAPHGRKRVFIVAHAADAEGNEQREPAEPRPLRPEPWDGRSGPTPDADRDGHGRELHPRGMGSVEGATAGEPRQRERPRRVADAGGAVSDGAASDPHNSAREQRVTRVGLPVTPRGAVAWGKYEPAIRRWEHLTRPAPEPTIPGNNGRPRLSPAFVEWMMGLPAGHVTGHDLRPAQELKMLGNGVCPQQAALALMSLVPFDVRKVTSQ